MELYELIKEGKKGSAAAQKYLFEELSPRMQVLCRRYVKSPEDAEELMLNGFYKFFKNLDGFNYRGDASVYGWLKKIMINECLMFLRKRNLFVITTENIPEDIQLEDSVLNNLSAAEIFNLVVQLPPGYRTVFNLYVIEGMSHTEIAGLLHISEGTSKSQLSKAKTLLQKMLLHNQNHYATRKTQ